MDILDQPPAVIDIDAELETLAKRYLGARRGGVEVITLLGTRAENWADRLPQSVRDGLSEATSAALTRANKIAQASRSAVPDQPGWVNSAVGAAMGAAGGFGGAPTALAELPVTTTLLLRVIQGVAAEHGFDPSEDSVQFDCISVFGSAGPMSSDDGAETGFLTARLALSGPALHRIIATVAPKLAAALGQKLAAQTVPILGAAAGAAINYAFTGYYRDMAHVQFGLRRLAVDSGTPEQDLIEAFKKRVERPPVKSA